MTRDDLATTSTLDLSQLANSLKQDCRLLWDANNKTEAMQLFRLFKKLTAELHRRRNPNWN